MVDCEIHCTGKFVANKSGFQFNSIVDCVAQVFKKIDLECFDPFDRAMISFILTESICR